MRQRECVPYAPLDNLAGRMLTLVRLVVLTSSLRPGPVSVPPAMFIAPAAHLLVVVFRVLLDIRSLQAPAPCAPPERMHLLAQLEHASHVLLEPFRARVLLLALFALLALSLMESPARLVSLGPLTTIS